MGATSFGLNIKKERVFINKELLQKEATKQWSLSSNVISKECIYEDGEVIVTIRNGIAEQSVICTGLSNEGNKLAFLIKLLRDRFILKKKAQIRSSYLFRNYLWNPFNEVTDSINSGDRFLIVLEDCSAKIKNAIKRI